MILDVSAPVTPPTVFGNHHLLSTIFTGPGGSFYDNLLKSRASSATPNKERKGETSPRIDRWPSCCLVVLSSPGVMLSQAYQAEWYPWLVWRVDRTGRTPKHEPSRKKETHRGLAMASWCRHRLPSAPFFAGSGTGPGLSPSGSARLRSLGVCPLQSQRLVPPPARRFW